MALRILQFGVVFAIGFYLGPTCGAFVGALEPADVNLTIHLKDPKDVIVAKGQSATFRCDVNSSLAGLEIIWHHNNITIYANDTKRIQISNGTLYIPKVVSGKRNNSVTGEYSCLVRNKEKDKERALLSSTAKLRTASIDREFLKQPANTTVYELQPTVLHCNIHSTPTAAIQWEFNNSPLPQNTRAMGGSNDHPCGLEFKYRLRWYLLGRKSVSVSTGNTKDQSTSSSNVSSSTELDDDIIITSDIISIDIHEKNLLDNSDAFQNYKPTEDQISLLDDFEASGCIEGEAMKYVAGYVAYRFRAIYPDLVDNTCQNVFEIGEKHNDWIDFVSRGKLCHPSKKLIDVALILEKEFYTIHGATLSKDCKIELNKKLKESIRSKQKKMHKVTNSKNYF